MNKVIIDISHHQKDFPWDTVKDEVLLTIVRPSHGMNDTDKEWSDNLAWLKANPDEPFAVYHYFYYQSPAQHNLEMQNFMHHIQPLLALPNFTKMAFLDFEHPSDVGTYRPIAACTPQQMTDYLVNDCAVIKHQGFIPGLYASRDWLRYKMQPDRFPVDCIIWLAHYTKEAGKTDYPYRWDIHQYTSQGRLESTGLFAGSLDMDYINPQTQIQTLINLINPPKKEDIPVAVKTYSKKTEGEAKVAPNFAVSEFACKDGSDTILLDTMLVVQLQRIRDYFKKPVKINSAYRTPAYNASVGGAGESFHTKGQAADIVVSGVSTQRVYYYCANTLNLPGVGRYAAKGFVHIDVGARAKKWRQLA